jgi:5,10-methylene-tetrahydrofolate dehydrogenase/methenyl tetrahydrofolate cyclohydrolase
MILPKHVLIDAGTSESEGKVVGDIDPQASEIAELFTPVPGGVGPVTVAMLFKNLCILTKDRMRSE